MEEKINWYRTPIERSLLKQLTVRNDWRGLLQSASILLLYAVTVFFSYYFFAQRMWVLMAVAAYVHCMLHGFVGMEASVHELSHGTPFKTKWVNEFFYHFFSFLTWNNGLHFRVSHMKHHQYTVHRGLDKEVVLEPINYNLLDYVSFLTFDFKKFKMYVFPFIAHFFGKADVDFFFWDPLFPPDDKRRKRMITYARLVVIGHLVLLGLFIYFQLWILIVVVTFGYFIATFPSRFCVFQQHLGMCPNVPDWRLSTHTVVFGPLTGYLYWHMNYHIEHHMYAAVPFFNLKKLHEAIAFDLPESPRGYWKGLGRVFAIQTKQRLNPAYCFKPAFPDTAAAPRTSC
jgi:fatty acid desaturase